MSVDTSDIFFGHINMDKARLLILFVQKSMDGGGVWYFVTPCIIFSNKRFAAVDNTT